MGVGPVELAQAHAIERDPGVVRRWISRLDEWAGQHNPIFAPWFAFAAAPEKDFAAHAPELAARFAENKDAEKPINPLVAAAFVGNPPFLSGTRISNVFGMMYFSWLTTAFPPAGHLCDEVRRLPD